MFWYIRTREWICNTVYRLVATSFQRMFFVLYLFPLRGTIVARVMFTLINTIYLYRTIPSMNISSTFR